MRLFDYLVSSNNDKDQWLESFSITSGLRYFGGKSVIGKFLMNHICNMACRMYLNKDKPHIFIDGFTGGGKIGLSIPEGWFDMIVMNDLNYGVYSFFKSCKENPTALIKIIEEIGEIYDEDLFRYFALNRSNGNQKKLKHTEALELIKDTKEKLSKGLITEEEANSTHYKFYEAHLDYIEDIKLDELVAGAMTYWVTQTTWNGDTEPSTATYSYSVADNKENSLSFTNEKIRIERAVTHAQKHIFYVNELMKRKNIFVENLDYRELIKKYNGMSYSDVSGKKCEAIEKYSRRNKLWYFDPPYHPATLFGAKPAPYEDTFSEELTLKMTDILANEHKDEYGELFYFIKSDYDPKNCHEVNLSELKSAEKKLKSKGGVASDEEEKDLKKLREKVKVTQAAFHHFDKLESGEYRKIKVGTFSKGGEGEDNTKTKGTEFIWCRG